MTSIDEHLETRLVFPCAQRFAFRLRGFARSATAASKYIIGIAQQITERIDVMNAVKHDLQALALINPGPETPIGFAVKLDAAVSGSAQPSVVDQQPRAADAGVPAHLLVNGNLHFRAFRDFHVANCFRIFISKRFLAQHMFASGGSLFDDFGLLGGIDGNVDDLHFRLTQQFFDAGVNFSNPVFFGGALGLLAIAVGYADNFEPSLLVCWQVGIVDNASGADDSDPVVQAFRQLGV